MFHAVSTWTRGSWEWLRNVCFLYNVIGIHILKISSGNEQADRKVTRRWRSDVLSSVWGLSRIEKKIWRKVGVWRLPYFTLNTFPFSFFSSVSREGLKRFPKVGIFITTSWSRAERNWDFGTGEEEREREGMSKFQDLITYPHVFRKKKSEELTHAWKVELAKN